MFLSILQSYKVITFFWDMNPTADAPDRFRLNVDDGIVFATLSGLHKDAAREVDRL